MIPPEMALSPPEGLLQSLQTLMTVSLARPLEKTWKIYDERVKVRQLQRRNCEKSKLKKIRRLFLICRRRRRLKFDLVCLAGNDLNQVGKNREGIGTILNGLANSFQILTLQK